MKFLGTAACILAYASSLAAAEVTFVVSLKPLPGKAHAAAQFLAKIIDSFHQIKPAGQLDLFAFENLDGRLVGIERYTDEKAAIDWALSKTHVDALLPMVGLFDLLSVRVTTDASLHAKSQVASSIERLQLGPA